MKKLTAFLLALCLMIPLLPAHAKEGVSIIPSTASWWGLAPEEPDPPAWAAPAYEALKARDIADLHTSGNITRGRFVILLVILLRRAFQSKELKGYPPAPEGYFVDAGYNSAVFRDAAGYGLVEGTVGADGLRRIDPDSNLTREQCAKMVCSLLDFVSQKLGYPLEPSGTPAVYADAASISSWALPYTQRIAAYGLMQGDNFGNFDPQGVLDWPSAVVLASRTLELMDGAVVQKSGTLFLKSETDWFEASQFPSGSVSRHGWVKGYYTINNGDGTVSTLVAKDDIITVERFAADGSLVSSKAIEWELPIFGTFLDSGSHFYLAFGMDNLDEKDDQEVWRIVQYDRDWNRLGSASVTGGESFTTVPFDLTVARMAVSGDGKTLALHAARRWYAIEDGRRHQANFTITVNTADMKVLSVSRKFDKNHVSHSFGQFVRYDGDEMVTVDHGDASPRAFVLYDKLDSAELFRFAGGYGDNVTNAIGSGLEISEGGYLFLGCSTPQKDYSAEMVGTPWNVFLTYTAKEVKEPTPPWPKGSTRTSLTILPGGSQYRVSWRDPDGMTTHFGTFDIEEELTTTFTWLTHSNTTIDCARLVKLNDNSFIAMWQEKDGEDIHYQRLDGKGQLVGQEQVYPHAIMPPTDPVVIDGDICWVQRSSLLQHLHKPVLYRIDL